MNRENTVEPAALLRQLADWNHELAERALLPNSTLAVLGVALEQSLGERLDAPPDAILVVMLCGPTSAGKSTLLNALAGEEISRTGLGATTGAAVLYVHDEDDPARLFEYGEALGELARRPHTVIRHRCGGLLHKVLVDTPDIDSVVREHRLLTESLVHAADLMVFVTTPARYKDLEGAEWICRQRGHRAMAFVMNKWDREGIGRQYDERTVVEQDFRQMLAKRGFQDAHLFKFSARRWLERSAANSAITSPIDQDELREFPELIAWLGQGLDRSASTAIQERRQRAAWGRLAAAVTVALPESLERHPWIASSELALDEARLEGRRLALAAMAQFSNPYADSSLWPVTPGLFGIYAGWLAWFSALSQRLASITSSSKLALPWSLRAAGPSPGMPSKPEERSECSFGHTIVRHFHDTTWRLLVDSGTRGIPLEPVRSGWAETESRLSLQLHNLPERLASEIILNATRFSLRRATGKVAVYLIELALLSVLLLTTWRVGLGFAKGIYMDSGLVLSALVLLVAFLLLGHSLARLFFPSLRGQLHKSLEHSAQETVDNTWRDAQRCLQNHIQDTCRLTRQGREYLGQIDSIIRFLAKPIDDDLARLFGASSVGTEILSTLNPPESSTAVAFPPSSGLLDDAAAKKATECRRSPQFE
jgi:energy-coupling factor transporter ATP-binding protein EcfA2